MHNMALKWDRPKAALLPCPLALRWAVRRQRRGITESFHINSSLKGAKMHVEKFLTAVAVAIAVSACSKPAPSESDAKNVIQGLLGDCRYLSLDRFERANGIPQGENGYQVEIKYAVKVTPVPENVRVIGDLSAKLSEVNQRLEKASNERREIHEKMNAIDDKSSKEYQELYSKAWEVGPLADKIEKEKRELINNSINPKANLAKECPNLNSVLYANVFDGEGVDQYTKSFTKEFGGTIMMVKTDKGWMAAK